MLHETNSEISDKKMGVWLQENMKAITFYKNWHEIYIMYKSVFFLFSAIQLHEYCSSSSC